MIPILFDHGETEFASNGLGRLADAISCTVTEELNGIYELEMVYPVTGRHYNDITFDRIIYTTHDDTRDPEPFDIYRKSEPLDGKVTVYARHISYRLNTIILEPYDGDSCTNVFAGITTHSVNANPFTFYNTVSKTAHFELDHPISVRGLLCGTDAMAIPQLYGGEYEWKKFTVYHREKRGRGDTSIELRYAKNIVDLTRDIDAGQAYGAVIPYWLSNDGAELAMLPEKIVVAEGSTSEKVGLLDLSHEFDIYPEEEDLRDMAEKALAETILPTENLTVSFYELWQTTEYEHFAILQRAYMGDDVRIIDPDLGIDTTLRVVKTVYNCLLDRYDSMELGRPSEPYGAVIQRQVEEMILRVTPTKSAMQLAIEHATQLITGGLGGHLVIGTDANGNPNELLIMDTTDKATAVNVLRLNLNGIGFSTTGYNGPFTTAWTIDSHFVADFITTGNLNASLLTVGTIRDSEGNIQFDLDAGTFNAELNSFRIVNGAQVLTVDQIASNAVTSSAVAAALTKQAVFNALTSNATVQGFFMDSVSRDIFVNLTGLRASGFLQVEDTNGNERFYVNGDTGEVRIFPTTLYITSSQTVQQYIDDNMMVESDIIDILKTNSQLQGIFITRNGRLYISWEYARGGALTLGDTNNSRGYLEVIGGSYNGYDRYQKIDVSGFKSGLQDPNDVTDEKYIQILGPNIMYYDSGTLTSSISVYGWVGKQIVGGMYIYCYNGVEVEGPEIAFTIKRNQSEAGSEAAIFKSTGCYFKKGVVLESISASSSGNVVRIQSGGELVVDTSSSKRYKNLVGDMSLAYAREILKITPLIFRYKDGYLVEGDESEGKDIPGFFAEDVEEHFPMGVYHLPDGRVENWKPDRLIPPMLRVMQDQQETIDRQQKQIDNLEARLAKLEALLT